MDIYTTELTDGVTVVDAIAALKSGTNSTTLSAARSIGEGVITIPSITNMTVGCTLVIDSGGGNEESVLVAVITAGSPNTLVLFTQLVNNHSISESVDLFDDILAGQDRTHLINGHLDQSYELDSIQEHFAYLFDTNVLSSIAGYAVVLKNFRSNPWATGSTISLFRVTGTNADGSGIATSVTQTVLGSEFGNGYAVAVNASASVGQNRYMLVGFSGGLGSSAAQIAQVYFLNKHTLSHNWEIADQERLPHGASIMESRSGKTFVQSHTNNARRDITKQFKALRQTDVDTIRDIYRLSDGPRRPFIADFASTRVASNMLLVRFANESAIDIRQTHFDQYDVTMQLQTIKQEDDR